MQNDLKQSVSADRKLSTEELAAAAKIKPESIRSAYCRDGHWLGLRPVKLPNRRLLWDAQAASSALGYDE